MIDQVVIPKGSPVQMKLARILDKEDALVVYNYKIVPVRSLDKGMVGFAFGSKKLIARGKIYQFFIEVREVISGAKVNYGRKPVKPAVVIFVEERPDSNDKSGKIRWATIEFPNGYQKTVRYTGLSMDEPMLIPVHFDYYQQCWDSYQYRDRLNKLPKELVGSYYSTKIIDGILYAVDPVYPKEKSEEELLMEMDPVNKQRLLEKLKKERAMLDDKIEILERKIT